MPVANAVDEDEDSNKQDNLIDRVRIFVREMLDDAADPPAISFALAYVATELGLAVADSPAHVFPVVLDAVSRATSSTFTDEVQDAKSEHSASNLSEIKTIQ